MLSEIIYFGDYDAIRSLRQVMAGENSLFGAVEVERIKRRMLMVAQFFQNFILIFQCVVLIGIVQVSLMLPPTFGLFHYATFVVFVVLSVVSISATFNFVKDAVIFMPGVFGVFFSRLQLCFARLKVGGRRGRMLRMLRFHRQTIYSLRYLAEVDRLYSDCLFIAFVTQTPMASTFLVVSLFNKQLPFYLSFLLLLGSLNHIFMFVVFHLLAGKFSDSLRSPFKTIMSMNLQVARCPLQHRLKVAHSIQAFYVGKRYGLKYKVINTHISLMSFTKVFVDNFCSILIIFIFISSFCFYSPN